MTKTRQSSSRPPARSPRATRKLPILPIAGGVVAVALVVTVLATFGTSDSEAAEIGEPVVTGSALPLAADGSSDAAIGLRIPEVRGADFDGNPVVITPDDGRVKMLLFIAHWCPHCQFEVPVVQDFVEAGNLPAEIDIYSIATGISPTRENYPPSEWLEREEWNVPVVVDDAASTIGRTFGLSAYPFWVFVDDQGNVLGRISGRIDADALAELTTRLVTDGVAAP